MKIQTRVILLIGGALLTGAIPAPAQDASQQIKAQFERIRTITQSAPADNAIWKQVKPDIEKSMAQGEENLKKGRLYEALNELDQSQTAIALGMGPGAEVLKKGMPAFDEQWKQAAAEVEARTKEARARNWAGVPAAVQAISQESLTEATPLVEGGRGFAVAAGPESGYYYLGEAKARAEFYEFSSGLRMGAPAAPFAGRSMLFEVQQLQQKALAAFQPPKSIDLHPQFIRLNAALKLAGELDASGFYAGSLYAYLSALRQYGMLDATVPNADQRKDLMRKLSEAEDRVKHSKADDSIAQLYIERATALVETKNVDDWKNVKVIVEQVLPAYYAARAAAPEQVAKNQKVVTLTLVRWPYT